MSGRTKKVPNVSLGYKPKPPSKVTATFGDVQSAATNGRKHQDLGQLGPQASSSAPGPVDLGPNLVKASFEVINQGHMIICVYKSHCIIIILYLHTIFLSEYQRTSQPG